MADVNGPYEWETKTQGGGGQGHTDASAAVRDVAPEGRATANPDASPRPTSLSIAALEAALPVVGSDD